MENLDGLCGSIFGLLRVPQLNDCQERERTQEEKHADKTKQYVYDRSLFLSVWLFPHASFPPPPTRVCAPSTSIAAALRFQGGGGVYMTWENNQRHNGWSLTNKSRIVFVVTITITSDITDSCMLPLPLPAYISESYLSSGPVLILWALERSVLSVNAGIYVAEVQGIHENIFWLLIDTASWSYHMQGQTNPNNISADRRGLGGTSRALQSTSTIGTGTSTGATHRRDLEKTN